MASTPSYHRPRQSRVVLLLLAALFWSACASIRVLTVADIEPGLADTPLGDIVIQDVTYLQIGVVSMDEFLREDCLLGLFTPNYRKPDRYCENYADFLLSVLPTSSREAQHDTPPAAPGA